ncbi:MAG: heme-binding protein [Anaerolineae bacterium]|nr:heme-binding protein [Anaerolineae bacterium]
MTTPVFMAAATNATMAFVMPAKFKPGETPKPSDDAVTVRRTGGAVRGAALQRRTQRQNEAKRWRG